MANRGTEQIDEAPADVGPDRFVFVAPATAASGCLSAEIEVIGPELHQLFVERMSVVTACV